MQLDSTPLDVARGIRGLLREVPEICATPATMLKEIREERVRIGCGS